MYFEIKSVIIILKIYFGLCFVIDIFSFVLYILILFFIGNKIIKKDKTYSSGFYKIIMLNGILDLIFIVEEYITFRIPQAGFFEHFYINIFSKYLISGMCIYISLSGITITFNRYIAIKYHTKYSYLWSGWRLILLSIWPLIISVCIFVIFHKIEVEYTLTDIGVISVQYKDLETNNLIFKIRLIIYLFALCINIILNVILLYTKKKKNNLAIINKNIKKREMKLEVTMAKFATVNC
uniref:Serpentine receptor class gamma n=1 Tax=Strongyloides stercoralis TaxID=6248 RepID=A0A0K0ETP9_STRER